MKEIGTLDIDAEDVQVEPEIELTKGGRSLKTTVMPKEDMIYALEEPYPTECYNHGQL